MVANNLESGIVFVEDYFDEVHLQNKTARNFSSANFSSANFGSPTAHSKSKSSTSILGNLSGAAESSQRLARLINKSKTTARTNFSLKIPWTALILIWKHHLLHLLQMTRAANRFITSREVWYLRILASY